MNNALTVFWAIFNNFIELIFNDFEILPNVTIGWILLSCIIFSILITSILNIPGNIRFNKPHRKDN